MVSGIHRGFWHTSPADKGRIVLYRETQVMGLPIFIKHSYCTFLAENTKPQAQNHNLPNYNTLLRSSSIQITQEKLYFEFSWEWVNLENTSVVSYYKFEWMCLSFLNHRLLNSFMYTCKMKSKLNAEKFLQHLWNPG